MMEIQLAFPILSLRVLIVLSFVAVGLQLRESEVSFAFICTVNLLGFHFCLPEKNFRSLRTSLSHHLPPEIAVS